jgi:tRNA(Ile)-lysidine synthase
VASLLPRCAFPPAGTDVVCAVSGGADSLAMLVLAVEAGCRATAVHVDHGLRPGSAREAEVVEAVARHVGAAFSGVPAAVAPGPNLEARARAARRSALPAGAMTGHTADDQAETVLLNLLRGSGLDGLAGMVPGPTKPILRLRRAETRALCDALGLRPVVDESNVDPAHLRNRVRAELLPLLDDLGARDVAGVIARQADLIRDDVTLLDELAGGLDASDGRALAAAPPALARRAVRRWLRAAGGDEAHPPDAATVERVLAVARHEARSTDVGGGWRVERSGGRLRLVPPPDGAE